MSLRGAVVTTGPRQRTPPTEDVLAWRSCHHWSTAGDASHRGCPTVAQLSPLVHGRARLPQGMSSRGAVVTTGPRQRTPSHRGCPRVAQLSPLVHGGTRLLQRMSYRGAVVTTGPRRHTPPTEDVLPWRSCHHWSTAEQPPTGDVLAWRSCHQWSTADDASHRGCPNVAQLSPLVHGRARLPQGMCSRGAVVTNGPQRVMPPTEDVLTWRSCHHWSTAEHASHRGCPRVAQLSPLVHGSARHPQRMSTPGRQFSPPTGDRCSSSSFTPEVVPLWDRTVNRSSGRVIELVRVFRSLTAAR